MCKLIIVHFALVKIENYKIIAYVRKDNGIMKKKKIAKIVIKHANHVIIIILNHQIINTTKINV